MTSPKHLWSGDWQQESESAARERAARALEARRSAQQRLQPQLPPPADDRDKRVAALLAALRATRAAGRARVAALRAAVSRRLGRLARALRSLRRSIRPRLVVLVALAALLIAGGAYGLSALTSSSSSSPAAASERAPWLGVQLEGLPTGGVVIALVQPGGPGELAGLEPGDVLTAIDNRTVNTVADVQRAGAGLRAGDMSEVQVSRGSTIYTANVTLAARPPGYP
ncbi:MAG: PDZ domain-containing protein [Solirubrobacteraceae bacterium]